MTNDKKFCLRCFVGDFFIAGKYFSSLKKLFEVITMLTIDDIKKVVEKIAPEYNLKKVTLFGSRANGNFREDSDIDLIVDFPENSTLLTLISLKHKLEDIFLINVDVVSRGGITKNSMLEIEKEIEIYAA